MKSISINGHQIGSGYKPYIIAEMSGNHNGSFDRAVAIVHAAKDAGADAIKLQTYTADTLTIDSKRPEFKINGSSWDGQYLYPLYKEASTPWEWQPKIKELADELSIDFFSSPFDPTAVDFLEGLDVPAYKVASPEIVDLPLIEYVASKNKPIIISTGMATIQEIEAAWRVGSQSVGGVAILQCNTSYPANISEMNLATIPALAERFNVPIGLSDHTLGITTSTAAIALGASIIEKHLTLARNDGGPDASFSMEPAEFAAMVRAANESFSAVGKVRVGPTESEKKLIVFRRSLFVVKDVNEGESFTSENVRSIRPAQGLPPSEFRNVLGKKAKCFIERGTPLSWELITN